MIKGTHFALQRCIAPLTFICGIRSYKPVKRVTQTQELLRPRCNCWIMLMENFLWYSRI